MPTKKKTEVGRLTVFAATNRDPIGPEDVPTGFGTRFNPKGVDELRYAKGILAGLPQGKRAVRPPTVDSLTVYPETIMPGAEPALGSAALLTELEPLLLDEDGRAKADLLVYLHGFSTTFREALAFTAQTVHNIRHWAQRAGIAIPDFVPLVFTWPSNGVVSIDDYRDDFQEARRSGLALLRFLARLSRYAADRARRAEAIWLDADKRGASPQPVNIHLIVQSMGHQVLADMLRHEAGAVQLGKVLSTGGDIGRSAFGPTGDLAGLRSLAQRIVAYSNADDGPLNLSQKVRGGEPRLGHVGPDDPLPGPGVTAVDVSAVMEGDDVTGHYYGRLNGRVQIDIAHVLGGAEPHQIPKRHPLGPWRYRLS